MTILPGIARKYVSFASLVLTDAGAILLSFYAAYLIRRGLLGAVRPGAIEGLTSFTPYFERWYLVLVWIVVFAYEGLYTKRHIFGDEARILLKSNTIAYGLLLTAVFATQQYLPFSRLIIVLAWLVSCAVLALSRWATKRLLLEVGAWRKRVLIIGSTEATAVVIDSIAHNLALGYEVIGCLTDDPSRVGQRISGVPILGLLDEVDAVRERTPFEDIIVTFPNIPRDRLIGLLKKWDGVSETIRYIPQTGDLITTGIEIENIGKVLSLAVRKNLHKPWNVLVKTVFETVLAVGLVVLFLPVFLIVPVAIKLDTKGPVLFRQERYGRRGRRIRILKLRTMYVDADRRLADHLASSPEARKEWETYKKLRTNDPRVTPVGAFLRRHSLDELPQLFNVLRGQMSLVGPRPYLRGEIDSITPFPALLFAVKPGLTGPWQTSGRSELSFQERLRIDEHYIRNWSLWMDIVILVKTFGVTASGRGAF